MNTFKQEKKLSIDSKNDCHISLSLTIFFISKVIYKVREISLNVHRLYEKIM